jgi:hypothetical protein
MGAPLSVVIRSEPLFRHANAALYFAFRQRVDYAQSTFFRTLEERLYGHGLSGLDAAAQAGMIRAEVDMLNRAERNIIITRFASDPKEWIAARLEILDVVIATLGTGMHSRRLIDALVQKHFGKSLTLVFIAFKFGVHRNTVAPKWRSVRAMLWKLEDRAMLEITDALAAAGVIEK